MSSTKRAKTTMKLPSVAAAKKIFKQSRSREFVGMGKGEARSVDWSCGGHRLAASGGTSVYVWSMERSHVLNELKGHSRTIQDVEWHPFNANQLASVSKDRSIRLWDVRRGAHSHNQKIETESENINMAWAPNGNELAVLDQKDCLTVYDVRTGKSTHKKKLDYAWECMWHSTGKFIIVCTGYGMVNLVNFPALDVVFDFHPHCSSCYSVVLDPTERYLATGGLDGICTLWDMTEIVQLNTFPMPEDSNCPITAVSFCCNSQFLACSGDHPTIWDFRSGEVVHEIERKTKADVVSVAWHPNLLLLASVEGGTENERPAVFVHGYPREHERSSTH